MDKRKGKGGTMKDLLKKARALQDDMVMWRRASHRQPGLTHQEAGTHRMIRGFLTACGIPFVTRGDTITAAEVKGALPGKTAAIRADTDALPVSEATGAEYASQVPGAMHACGHDMHAAIGLGAAKLLWAVRDRLAGRALVIFQPAEEGGHGAAKVVESGLADGVDAFFALHVWPQLETGKYQLSPGPVCAATEKLVMQFNGRGGHGAYPEMSHSALLAAAETAAALKRLVPDAPRERPLHVMSMGQLHAGSNWNVIPGEARLEGSLRTLDEALRKKLHGQIEEITRETARKHGCAASLLVDAVCEIVYNDKALTERVRPALIEALGEGAWGAQQTAMIGDDFSDYRAIGPCCYAHLGVKRADQPEIFPLHHPCFNPDEAAMPIGLAGLAAGVFAALEG